MSHPRFVICGPNGVMELESREGKKVLVYGTKAQVFVGVQEAWAAIDHSMEYAKRGEDPTEWCLSDYKTYPLVGGLQ